MRILLFREIWAGPPQLTSHTDIDNALRKLASQGNTHTNTASQTAVPTPSVSSTDTGSTSTGSTSEEASGAWARVKEALREPALLPRAQPSQLNGSWSVFTVSATCIEENDLMTGACAKHC